MDFHSLKKFNKKTAGAKHLLSFIITDANRKRLNAYLKDRLKERMRRRAFEDRAANLKDVVGSCMRHITPVTQPLVLIDSLPFCGRDPLNQLFDGHPQLHVCPAELKLEFDDQKNTSGSKTDPVSNPQKWFAVLAQESIDTHLEEVHKNLDIIGSSQPFVFIPYLQKRIFRRYLKSVTPRNLRTVYNAYMTSYFGSWLNYANLTGHDKKYIVGLSKTHAIHPERVDQFFEVYPEGRLISVIREPKSWFSSATRQEASQYGEINHALEQWLDSAKSMIENRRQYGDRVCIITFEDLVSRTDPVLHLLVEFLGINFDSILLTPTFNKAPLQTNRSFQPQKTGILPGAEERSETLSSEQLDMIEAMTGDMYNQVLKQAICLS